MKNVGQVGGKNFYLLIIGLTRKIFLRLVINEKQEKNSIILFG